MGDTFVGSTQQTAQQAYQTIAATRLRFACLFVCVFVHVCCCCLMVRSNRYQMNTCSRLFSKTNANFRFVTHLTHGKLEVKCASALLIGFLFYFISHWCTFLPTPQLQPPWPAATRQSTSNINQYLITSVEYSCRATVQAMVFRFHVRKDCAVVLSAQP